MALQINIQTLQVLGVDRIPLSEILETEEAITRLANSIIEIHKNQRRDKEPHPHIAIIGNDTEVLWNVLLNYYRGQQVDLISGEDYVVDGKFVLPEPLLQESLGWLIDVDISEDKIEKLPKDHPYWVMKNLMSLFEAKRALISDVTDKGKVNFAALSEDETKALARGTVFLAGLTRKIYKEDEDLVRYRSDPKYIDGNVVVLENGEKINADYIFKA